MLQKLSETSIIIADGLFKARPEPFEQIYVIFGIFDERKFPLVLAILEGKTTNHYRIYQTQNWGNFLIQSPGKNHL